MPEYLFEKQSGEVNVQGRGTRAFYPCTEKPKGFLDSNFKNIDIMIALDKKDEEA